MKYAAFCLFFLGCLCPVRARDAESAAMQDEIRKNADKLELFPLEYDANNQAVIRFIDPKKNYFLYDGKRFFGFRFKTPDKIEGDLSWMYLLRSANGPTSTGAMLWYIVRRKGEMQGFSTYNHTYVREYPKLQEKFPNTNQLTLQSLGKEAFQPNEEYIIWFSLIEGDNMVEFAVALSFLEAGQESETARLPLGPPRKEGPDIRDLDRKLTSYEDDPW